MQKKRKGFTLVELVIVIAVIAVLSAVLIPTFSGVITNANVAKDKANLKTLNTQLAIYKAEENAENVDIHAAYTWFTNNGHDLTSKAKGYTYWLDTKTSSVMLCKTDEALSNNAQNANASPLVAYADEPQTEPNSKRANDPGALSPNNPSWVLLDQSEDDPICKAINGIRKLVKNAGGQENMSSKFNEYISLLDGDEYQTIREFLRANFDPANTVYFAEDGFYGCTGSAKNYYFDLGITALNANSANAVSFEANTEIVFPVTLSLLLPGSFDKIGGENLKLTLTNKNIHILPGALNSTVANSNNIVPTVPEGQTAFVMKTEYKQKEAFYLDESNVVRSVRVTGETLTGNLSDYGISGGTLLREYLVPTINFSSVQEGMAMQGIKSVQTYTRVYGNIVSYYGVAYNANGGVLAVSSKVGYVTDVTVGIVNNNNDQQETKGNWTIDVSDPERNFEYDGDIQISVTYKVNGGAAQTVTLTQGSGDVTDYNSGVITASNAGGNSIVITKIEIKSDNKTLFTKTGESLAFHSTAK